MSAPIVFPRLLLPLERTALRELNECKEPLRTEILMAWRNTGWQLGAALALCMTFSPELTLYAMTLNPIDLPEVTAFARRVVSVLRFVIYPACAFGMAHAYMLMIEERAARRLLATRGVKTEGVTNTVTSRAADENRKS